MKPNGLVFAASITSHTSMSMLVAHQRDLVHETDVDRAERVLEQLHHLGDARRADRHDRRRRPRVEQRTAASVLAGPMPPTTFGMFWS